MDIRGLIEKYVWILNLVLIFLLCYLVAGSVNTYISSLYFSTSQVSVPRDRSSPSSAGAARETGIQGIMDRNIFNAMISWAEESVSLDGVGEGEIEETTLRAKLLGVIYFFAGSALNRATIRLIQENKSDVFREGDTLTQEIKVAKIETKRVILQREDGRLEELSLEEEEPAGPGKGSAKREFAPKHSGMSPDERADALSEYRKAMGIDNRIRKISDTEYTIERSAITDSLSDLNTLFTQMRLTPNFVGEGDEKTVDGFRVFRVKSGSVFQKLGIRNGDIILKINGVNMDNPENAFQLLQQLRYENSFSLLIRRNDQEMDINYNVTE